MIDPLGLDEREPVFSWKFQSDEPGMHQKRARVQVRRSGSGEICWDTGVLETDRSIGIRYAGKTLCAETAYKVLVTVWNQDGESDAAAGCFETGLLDSSMKAWEGARWIGAPEYSVASETVSVFVLESTICVEKGDRAGIVFGANDPRLKDAEKNELGLAGENYFSYVLNIGTNPASVEIYRVGYDRADRADVPLAVIPVVGVETGERILTEENKREPHKLTVEVCGNTAYAYVDGIKIDEVEQQTFLGTVKGPRTLNPLGATDVTTYPRLCGIGYYAGKGTRASFDGLRVRNLRTPCAEIVSLDTEQGKILDAAQGKAQCESLDTEHGKASDETSNAAMHGKTLEEGTGGVMEITDPSKHSIPMLRRDFQASRQIKSVRLYATARGIYECRINGQPVSEEYFAPGDSQYDKHLYYQTYDVTKLLCEGDNAIGCILASGWWSDSITYTLSNYNYWGDRMSFLCKLVLHYEDGTRDVVTTNAREWQYYGEGPYRFAGFFNGEQYDARKAGIWEQFSMPGFSIEGWKRPEIIAPVFIEENRTAMPPWPAVNATEPELVGSYQAPVREAELFTAKSMTEPAKGIYIYDLGQEIAGVPRIRLHGKEGQRVVLRFAEMLYPDKAEYGALVGKLLQANLREASNIDVYICAGREEEVYQPRFTFHGYRFIEISGLEEPPALEDVQSILLSSVPQLTGSFCCSDELVNRLVSNVGYSQQCNFISIPTDCPQRNERMGWVGDAHVFCKAAGYQCDTKNFYLRYLDMMRDLQAENGRLPDIAPIGGGFGGITYESAMILMVWELYQQYGDPDVIREYYDAMDRWMTAIAATGLPGMTTDFGLGDWLAMEETDNQLIWNAFYYRDAKRMETYATVLGKKQDAEKYARIAAQTKKFWNETFLEPETGRTLTADGKLCDTQGSYAIALNCGVYQGSEQSIDREAELGMSQNVEREAELGVSRDVDREANLEISQKVDPEACCETNKEANRKTYKEQAYTHLDRKVRESGYTVQTGFFGTGVLNAMLSEGGYEETAGRLLTSTAYPGWLYPVTQGATTVWERWNSYTEADGFGSNNAMNSFNHYSLGSVITWLYENVLGLQRDEAHPGYQHFILKPETGIFWFAKGGMETPYGRIESAWEKNEDGSRIFLRFHVPENTTATLILKEECRELESGNYEFCISEKC